MYVGVLYDISRKLMIANQPLLRTGPEPTEFGEITQNYGHYAVQGHSRLPILVSVESPYTTSYISE